ncbi:TolB family protein [Shouchella sp. JSM 1781072]|uniref:TolB family protein n=1 Tax=Shouchella sp. JSM 1781072 TaxID=3344581 RepID=UPI0035BF329E
MGEYNSTERKLAIFLDRFPSAKKMAKKAYQRINYARYRQKGFTFEINDLVELEEARTNFKVSESTKEYFFGYYDKTPWSPDMKSAIYQEKLDNGLLEIVLYDINNGKFSIGKTKTWNHQQGSMAQFLPNSKGNIVIFNSIKDDKLVANITNLDEKTDEIYPYPVQTVHPDGKEYLSINYKRLQLIKPEYGYEPECENFEPNGKEDEDGIWRFDLNSKSVETIINIKQLKDLKPRTEMKNCLHKINHVIYSPDGMHFVFMHRWSGSNGRYSRLLVSDNLGERIDILLDENMISHYHWINNEEIITWARTRKFGDKYYRINILTKDISVIGEGQLDKFGDGHPTISPNGDWVLTDSYPDKARQRHLLMYNLKNGELYKIGRFFSPWNFDGEIRCDLHPRWSPDGKKISIDSTHEGIRKSYILDVSSIVI